MGKKCFSLLQFITQKTLPFHEKNEKNQWNFENFGDFVPL